MYLFKFKTMLVSLKPSTTLYIMLVDILCTNDQGPDRARAPVGAQLEAFLDRFLWCSGDQQRLEADGAAPSLKAV